MTKSGVLVSLYHWWWTIIWIDHVNRPLRILTNVLYTRPHRIRPTLACDALQGSGIGAIENGAQQRIAQAGRQGAFELSDATDAPGLVLYPAYAGRAPCMEAGQGLVHRELFPQQLDQHHRVLEGHGGALAHVGRHGVRCVADQQHAPVIPRALGQLFQVVVDELLGRSKRVEDLRYLTAESMASLFVFGGDTSRVPTLVNRLNNQVLVAYYDEEWSRWN